MNHAAGSRRSWIGLWPIAWVTLCALAAWAADERPAAPAANAAPSATTAGDERFVNFSFDQVEIAAFVRLVGEMTDRKFVVADNVKGKITVVSPKVSRKDVYGLFVGILEAAGCAVVEEGGVSRVMPMPERTTLFAPVVGAAEPIPSAGIVTKIFRLQHVSVSEVRKLLETKVAGGKIGAVGAVDETNHLLVTDTAENVRRIEKIVGEIDRPGLAQLTEVLPLSFVSADDIAHELNAAIAEEETRGDALRRRLPVTTETSQTAPRRAMVVPSPHANSLILVGTAEKILALKRLIAAVDVDAPGTRGRLNAIFLKYIAAEEAAKSLNALLKPADKATEGQARRHAIAIEASLANNALLVDAAPSDFEVVKKLVDQLDQPVDQVHIEVVIAEMTEGESLDIGVEMAALDMPSAVGDNVVQGGTRLNDGSSGLMTALQENLFPRGLSLGVARGTRVDSSGKMVLGYPTAINIDALKKDSRLKIRSNPSLMAQNNKEASVNIVNQIPILKSTIQGGTGTTRDVIQNIDRVDVGIKLKLTPTIIPGGQIRMVLNPSIEAVIDQGPSGTQFAPTIARREVSTTVTVRDTETIVIAGLTREDQTKRVRKIPLLGSIPLLGWLFRRTEDATEKSNVLIFVTPLIVSDAGTSARVTERLEKKTGLKTDEAK